jgi:hypothetical protein
MIERDEMLRLVRRERDDAENGYAVSQSGSEAVTLWRRRADVLLAIEDLIRTAPDPGNVKRLVEKARLLCNSVYAAPGLRQTTSGGTGCIVSTFRFDELQAALAEVEDDKAEAREARGK